MDAAIDPGGVDFASCREASRWVAMARADRPSRHRSKILTAVILLACTAATIGWLGFDAFALRQPRCTDQPTPRTAPVVGEQNQRAHHQRGDGFARYLHVAERGADGDIRVPPLAILPCSTQRRRIGRPAAAAASGTIWMATLEHLKEFAHFVGN